MDTWTLADGAALPWINGMEVYATMEPAFRENLGDETRVAELFSRYNMRSLWLDPLTTRRIDHVRADPGYIDLSEAYHDSVEEGYVMGGDIVLSAEGSHIAGDYFWRPPGWVHSARASEGFDMLLMMEGLDPTEGSGRVSRVIRADGEIGQHVPSADRDPLGPRGYVRRAEARYMVWTTGDDELPKFGGSLPLLQKTLSRNAETGASTLLARAPSKVTLRPAPTDRERFVINTRGSMLVDDSELRECSLVNIPPGSTAPPIHIGVDTELLIKVSAPR